MGRHDRTPTGRSNRGSKTKSRSKPGEKLANKTNKIANKRMHAIQVVGPWKEILTPEFMWSNIAIVIHILAKGDK